MPGLASACRELANYYNYIKVYHNNCYAAEDGTVLRDTTLKGNFISHVQLRLGALLSK